MKAEIKTENGTVSVWSSGTVVGIMFGDFEFKLSVHEAKDLLKMLKIIL